MLRTFIQFLSLVVTFIATFFWIRGAALLTVKDIAGLAGTYLNYSPVTLKSLASQKADSLIAGLLLSISFLLQCWNVLWLMRFCDFAISKWGVILSVVTGVFLLVICYLGSSWLTNYYFSQAKAFLSAK